jgi:hypothetical protein
MWKKAFLSLLFFVLMVPSLSFAASYDLPVDRLITPIDSVCGATLGDTIESVRQKIQMGQYSPEWSASFKEKAATQYGQEYDLLDQPPKTSYDIRRTLTVNADIDGKVNQISYVLYCRANDAAYQNFLQSLIQTATTNYGTPQEQTSAVGSTGRAQHKIWLLGNQRLSIVTYSSPGYDPQHPHIIRIIRSVN